MDLPISAQIASNLEFLPETGSTNADLVAKASNTDDFSVLVAGYQTAGKGRAGREWLAPAGSSLFVSILLKPAGIDPANYSFLPLLAGLAMTRCVSEFLPNSKVVQNFCPSTKTNYSEIVVVEDGGKEIIFQPVNAKNNGIYKLDDKYYIPFSHRIKPPKLSYKSDYILISNGPIYRNYKIIQGIRYWESPEPPVYSPTDRIINISKKVR
jgi:hypothetical protein